ARSDSRRMPCRRWRNSDRSIFRGWCSTTGRCAGNGAGLPLRLGRPFSRRSRHTRKPTPTGWRGVMNDVGSLQRPSLALLSIVMPARDEEGCIAATVEHLHLELRLHDVPHEIVVVDDGSKDSTWRILQKVAATMPELRPLRNDGPHGFGRAIIYGLDRIRGDAVVIMMADESDDCRDVVAYWRTLNQGWDCSFGSRFIRGGGVIDYPLLKRVFNRLAHWMIMFIFRIRLNDTTNAFKAYRRTVIDGCRPFLSPHFNLTVELPLKAIV